jgi:hypothetical protein
MRKTINLNLVAKELQIKKDDLYTNDIIVYVEEVRINNVLDEILKVIPKDALVKKIEEY